MQAWPVRAVGRALACALIAGGLAAVATTTSRSADIHDLMQQLVDCRQELADLRQAVSTDEELIADARSGKWVFVIVGPALVPIRTSDLTRFLFLSLAEGKLTPRGLQDIIRNLSKRAASTRAALEQGLQEDRDARDKTGIRCADLAKQLDAAQTGAGSGSTAAAGAFPGGSAATLTLTLAGKTVETNLKSNKQSPDHTAFSIPAKSDGTTLKGSVKLDGSLPPGWELVVFSASSKSGVEVRYRGTEGGSFEIPPPFVGFAAAGQVGAYICSATGKWVINNGCSPAAQADIDISWSQ